MILLGVEALPVLGFLLERRRSQTRKVHVKQGSRRKSKTNGKGLVTGVVQLLSIIKKLKIACEPRETNTDYTTIFVAINERTSNMMRSIPFI